MSGKAYFSVIRRNKKIMVSHDFLAQKNIFFFAFLQWNNVKVKNNYLGRYIVVNTEQWFWKSAKRFSYMGGQNMIYISISNDRVAFEISKYRFKITS